MKNKLKLPNLTGVKTNIITNIQNKKNNSARDELIDNLKKKMTKSNNSDYKDYSNMKNEIESQDALYTIESDDFNLRNQDENKRLNSLNKELSRRAYMKELKEVIDNSDVIIQVLDARDPLSCRSKELESQIQSHKDGKKIILVLNKIDLIPMYEYKFFYKINFIFYEINFWRENALIWKKYLRREFPTVLFKANLQNQNSNLSQEKLFNSSILEKKEYVQEVLNTNKAIGGENLLNLLKNYCRVEDSKRSITVGIVGFPNVGKSSIINSLKRGKVVGVSSTPGYTKSMQEIILDKNIKLLDSPGVVFSNSLDKEYNMILHNVIRIEDVKDPIEVVSVILNKVPKETIIELYKLESQWERTEQFLWLIGDKMKKYKKVKIIFIYLGRSYRFW